MREIRDKLRSRGGFSLTELLVATAIVGILTAMGAMGIAAAERSRAQTIRLADAQTLASTAAEAICNELRFGRISKVDGTAVTVDSASYGAGISITASDGTLKAGKAGNYYEMLGAAAYRSGGHGGSSYTPLWLEVTFAGGAGGAVSFVVTVRDTDADGDKLWETQTVTVLPLNQP